MTTEQVQNKAQEKQPAKIVFKKRYFVNKAQAHRRMALIVVADSQGEVNRLLADETMQELHLNGVEVDRLKSFTGDLCQGDILDCFQKKTVSAR